MKVNTYRLMDDCVERGVQAGWNRAYKHTDTPTPDFIIMAIENAVMSEICDYFMFDGDAREPTSVSTDR